MGRSGLDGEAGLLKSLVRARGDPPRPSARPAGGASSGALWMVAGLALAALFVQVTRSGVDVLIVLALCAIVAAIERTLGDWAAELVGPGWASVALAALIAPIVWLLFAEGGTVDRFYLVAERAGYRRYFSNAGSPAPPPDQTASSSPLAVSTSGSGTRVRIPVGSRQYPTASDAASRHPAAGPASSSPPSRQRSIVRIELPRRVAPGDSVQIQAHVSAGGAPVPGASVVFVIDGVSGRVTTTDRRGIATVMLGVRRGRTYDIWARVAGSRQWRESSTRATLRAGS